MDVAFFPAPAPLASFVRGVWTLRGLGSGEADPIFPDGCSEVVFNLGELVSGGPSVSQTSTHQRAQAVGQIEGPLFLRTPGRVDLIGLRLQPWGAGILFPGQQQKSNVFCDAAQLLGSASCSALLERLGTLQAQHDRAQLLFGEAARLVRQLDPQTIAALSVVDALPVTATVDSWARQAELSTRQLSRLARHWIGLSPKFFLRMRRFQSMIRSLSANPSLGLGRVALEAGYYDQSHVSRDFLQFAGASPGRALTSIGAVTGAMFRDEDLRGDVNLWAPHLPG